MKNLAAVLAIMLCAASSAGFAGGRSSETPALYRSVVIDDLKSPWSMAFVDESTALITEKEGGIVIANLKTGKTTPIDGLPGDLVDDVREAVPFDNGGLFDIALAQDFVQQPWVYISYAAKSDKGRTTKVARAHLAGTTLSDFQTLFVAEPYTEDEYFHYGGGLTFGSDGKLYVTVGERLFNEIDGPAMSIAQNYSDKRGKIYRLNPDGTAPEDNPDFGPDAPAGLYAAGIRAAQGIAVHPETGEIWFTEHGSQQGDEINRLQAGANYGWPVVTTGSYRDDSFQPPELSDRSFTDPVWSWAQTVAPTGLVFYSGAEFPQWQGDLFVSGLSQGSLWRMNFEYGEIVSVEELFVHDRVRSRKVAVSPGGALYMLTDTLLQRGENGGLEYTGEPGGQLLRIERR